MAYVRKMPPKVRRPVEQMRIGVMLPADFEGSLQHSLGQSWAKSWCKGTGQCNSTLRRYLDGAYPIPQYVAVLVELLATCRLQGLPMPVAFSFEPDALPVSPLRDAETRALGGAEQPKVMEGGAIPGKTRPRGQK